MTRRGIFLFFFMCILALSVYATNYAIVVGIDDYRYLIPLSYAEKDARDMEAALKGFGYEVTLLTGRTATKEVIRSEIAYLSEQAERKSGEGKLLFFYFSGHGIGGEETGLYTTYMKPGDTPYTQEELIEDLEQFPGERVLFLDACYQGQGRSELVVNTDQKL